MFLRLRRCGRVAIGERYTLSCTNYCSGKDPKEKQETRPFKDIPGPLALPVIGTLYTYFPYIGEYTLSNLYENGRKKLFRYGPLVKEEIQPGVALVSVFRPEDIAEVFKADARLHPKRKSHLSLLKYRKDRSHIYSTGGLLPTNGDDWWRIRKEFQKVLSKPQNVVDYLEDTNNVIREFVELCTREKFDDFLPLLSRLFLELTCLVAFDVRMHSLSKEERQPGSKTSKLIDAAYVTNEVILKLDNGPKLWRYFETPLYKKLRKAQNYMEQIAVEMVHQKSRDTTIHRKGSLLDAYLKNPALDTKDIVGMACDLLLAGIDTTTYTISFALYYIAENPQVQERLRQEAAALLPSLDAPVTANTLKNASYTKAVIKETLRLNPISIGVGRILQTDVVLNGYNVPKDTLVVTQNHVTCRLPEYFDDPDTFIPERWLKDNSENIRGSGKSVHPYLVLPFGHGPRSCIARRFAEQNMQTLLLRISRELRCVWRGGKLGFKATLINKPDAPLNFEFYKDPGN